MSLEYIEKFSQKKLKPQKNETKEDIARKLTHLYLNGRNILVIVSIALLITLLFNHSHYAPIHI